jgi:CubicO group peptidase (beta-lactamase class C family)
MKRIAFIFLFCALPAFAQLPSTTQAAVDEVVGKVLTETGAPSVSIAITRNGSIAYEHAYGDARLEPKTLATPAMRYKIASNSKQFAATAILMLAEAGKLSLDDKVARFLPELTRANEVTIRELLTHTSGYQDYYPLDFVAPFMEGKASPQHILDVWAKKALDFDPGTKFQYSNTNYVIAGQIIEKITGKPMIDFLRARIFKPLGMGSVIEVDREPWTDRDPAGYRQFALGPSRPAPFEGAGWMYAAGELAMTAHDLALWDISLMYQVRMTHPLLKPESMAALTTEMKLKNGMGTSYALGLAIAYSDGHRRWTHTGGAAGFLSENTMRPDDGYSVTVLSNSETQAFTQIARRLETLLAPHTEDAKEAAALDAARKIFRGLQEGKLDRSLLSDDGNFYFSDQAIADFETSLKPLGAPAGFVQTFAGDRGGMTARGFGIRAGGKTLRLSTFFTPDGKVSQYLITMIPQ